MRILIAEDELLERKAMVKFIAANFTDLEVVGEASNGRKAIELARHYKPDIIFMDIKMPGINGLEAIETIIHETASVKFILVSAYDSFAYAKKAMQFGIKEYILKPGKKVDIIQAIRRVQKEIIREREQLAEQSQTNQLVKEHLLTKLMKYPVDDATKRLQQQFFPQLKNGYFLVVQAVNEISYDQVKQIFTFHLPASFIMQQQGDWYNVCVFSSAKVDKAVILQTARMIQMTLGGNSFIGASYSYPVDDLPKAYHEAFSACFELEKGQNRHYGFFMSKRTYLSINQPVAKLLDLIERCNEQEALQFYRDYMGQFTANDRDEIYMKIKSMLTNRGLTAPEQSLSDLTTTKDWEKFITVCCLRMQEYHQSKQYMEKAKQFIKQHYRDTITLEETADQVNLSPNYFSNLFKQEEGATFIEYVTRVRLQKAKELLEENSYSLKEISALVGYNDPNYFSRVFKKHYSKSPKQFQQAIGSKT